MPTKKEIKNLTDDTTSVATKGIKKLVDKYETSDITPSVLLLTLVAVHISTLSSYVQTCCPEETIAAVEMECVSDILAMVAQEFPNVLQEVHVKYEDSDGNEIHPAEGLH